MDLMPSTPEALLASLARSQLKGVVTPFADGGACLGTRPGATRTSVEGNQDRTLCARFTDATGQYADAFVICDGIGGLAEGGRCAEIALAAFLLGLASRLGSGFASDPYQMLFHAIELANERLFAEFGGRGGTTLSCLLSYGGAVVACSVGDTRLFLVETEGMRQISVDDTMRGALLAAGHARVDPHPEHDKLIQYVGMGPDLVPHVLRVPVQNTLRFVLACTDGAYRLPSDAFSKIAAKATTAKQLVERLLFVSDWLGGVDDASAVALSTTFLQARAQTEAFAFPPGRDVMILRVWGAAQIGQPSTLYLDGRRDAFSRPHFPSLTGTILEPRASLQEAQLPSPPTPATKRPGKGGKKRVRQVAAREAAKQGNDVIFEVIASPPLTSSLDEPRDEDHEEHEEAEIEVNEEDDDRRRRLIR